MTTKEKIGAILLATILGLANVSPVIYACMRDSAALSGR